MKRLFVLLGALACGLALAATPNGLTNRNVARIASAERGGGAAGGGGPTLIITEPFTYANNPIATASGGVWALTSGAIDVVSNRIQAFSAGAHSVAYHTTAVNANMRAEITYAADSTSYIGVAVRVQASGDSAYVCFSDGTNLHLWQISGGVETVMQTAAVALSAGNRIALEANGAGTACRLKVQVDTGSGWVDQWTNQDPAVDLDGGFSGVSGYGSGTTAADDFKAYNL